MKRGIFPGLAYFPNVIPPAIFAGALAASFLTGCASGDYIKDEAMYQKDIVDACMGSGLFKAADGVVTMFVPEATLPVDLVNAGVDVVCAHPNVFGAADARTADWTLSAGEKTGAWVRRVIAEAKAKL